DGRLRTWGYGAMELRGAPRARDITEAQAETILNEVLDAGINYIDTSIDYGLSEEPIGRYISHRRAEYYLASKCGCLVGAPPMPRGQRGQHVFTRDNVVAGVEQSLVRMKTDYLDVVQFHSSPSRQTLEEHGALEALLELKEAGKVRFVGMTPMEFILRFTFTNPDLDTTIVGTINPAHLQTNLDILQQGPLPPDLYEEAKQRLAAAGSAPKVGPE